MILSSEYLHHRDTLGKHFPIPVVNSAALTFVKGTKYRDEKINASVAALMLLVLFNSLLGKKQLLRKY